jgi:hypothetical protein
MKNTKLPDGRLSCFSKEIEVLSFEDCGTLEKKKKEHVYE